MADDAFTTEAPPSAVAALKAEDARDASTAPGSGALTPLILNPEQQEKSLKVTLADMSAKATALYAQKKYDEAVELYSAAAEMQAEMHGDMNPENAEILFLYGRALFRVGQAKSDVLGGRAADANMARKKAKSKAKPKSTVTPAPTNGGGDTHGRADEGDAAAKHESDAPEPRAAEPNKDDADVPQKPLFQFEGDENLYGSEEDKDAQDAEDDGVGEEEAEDEDEEEDLGVAFEILDLSRVLFNKKLDLLLHTKAEEDGQDKGKDVAAAPVVVHDSPEMVHITERLADAHDLLAEISLENERYPNAITDFRESLRLKKARYPPESELIAEAHFKLSLALEFASVTASNEDGGGNGGAKEMDQGLRDEAVQELEAAIHSTKLKLENKEVELATLHNPEENEASRKTIAEVRDMLNEMNQRLEDLKKPPVDMQAALGGAMGQLLGSNTSSAEGSARLEEAKKNATDLSALVRKKRKAEDGAAQEATAAEAKKVKTDDTEVAAV